MIDIDKFKEQIKDPHMYSSGFLWGVEHFLFVSSILSGLAVGIFAIIPQGALWLAIKMRRSRRDLKGDSVVYSKLSGFEVTALAGDIVLPAWRKPVEVIRKIRRKGEAHSIEIVSEEEMDQLLRAEEEPTSLS